MKKLNREEQQVLAAFESGALRSVDYFGGRLGDATRNTARATLAKQQRVNIRLSAKHWRTSDRVPPEEGMPYQTLMASVLHKYTTGRFVEKRGGSLRTVEAGPLRKARRGLNPMAIPMMRNKAGPLHPNSPLASRPQDPARPGASSLFRCLPRGLSRDTAP